MKSARTMSSKLAFIRTPGCLIAALCLFFAPAFSSANQIYEGEAAFSGRYEARMKGQAPVYGGTLRSHMQTEPRSLDPHMDTSSSTVLVSNVAYNGLLRLAPDMKNIEPDLAESWQQIDDLTYEFKLHQGVRFHNIPPVNGREMTSADVKYSFERIMGMYGKKSQFKHSYYFADKIESIETPDKYTIIFKTKKPYAPFIAYVASNWTKIVPREAVDEFGDLKRKMIGTGPFMLKEYLKGSHMLFVKNPNYFVKERPYLDAVHFKIIKNRKVEVAAYMANELDVGRVNVNDLATIAEKSPETILLKYPNMFTWTLRTPAWLGEKGIQKPFDDIRVRQAIAHAIDKKKLMYLASSPDGIIQVGPVPRQFVPWGLPESDQWEYNPQKARELLTQAGYPDGFETEIITFNLAYMVKPMQVIQQMLQQVGIKAKLNPMDPAQYLNATYRYKYQMALHMTTTGFDPSEWLVPYFGFPKSATYYKWGNKELWELIAKQEYIMDKNARVKAVADIQRKIVEECMSQSLYTQISIRAFRPNIHLRHYMHPSSEGIHEFDWIEKQ